MQICHCGEARWETYAWSTRDWSVLDVIAELDGSADSCGVSADGMRIVKQAAEASRTAQVQIQVTGYTDASGSAGYNQRLSERRANNVANALVRFGVPRQAMVVSGRGKNDQRVPTADGVREPQNRRVEIVFP